MPKYLFSYHGGELPPAAMRATVEAKLASPDYKVEIMMVAAR